MKIAVLLTGEYRTFNYCRKTQLFLDQPEVDVYFHTWNVTNTINPQRVGTEGWENYRPVNRDVTYEEVSQALKIPAVIQINPLPAGNPMIVGWLNGLEMVRSSGIEYDYMMVLRPDTFFAPRAKLALDLLHYYDTRIGIRSPNSHLQHKELDDTSFFSSYKNIQKILTEDLFSYNYLGHQQWYEHVILKNNLRPTPFPILPDRTIARYPIDDNTDFKTVQKLYFDWAVLGK